MVDQERLRVLVVNGTGLRILEWLESGASHRDLVDRMAAEYEIDSACASADVEAYLKELAEEGLVKEAGA